VIAVEEWCDAGDAGWTRPDDAIATRAAAELEGCGLLGGARVTAAHVERLVGSHPSPRLGTSGRLATIGRHVAAFAGLSTVGRHGSFATPGVGQAMGAALELVDELLAPGAVVRHA
jgi:hypothetical protein